MKKLFALSILSISTSISFSQTYHADTLVSYVSPKKDTLYLVNDALGQTIYDIWKNDKKTYDKPVIIFVDDKKLARLNSLK